MKTLTEFSAGVLLNAVKTKKDLIAAGKTPEELPAAMGEALKVEGDRLAHLMAAVEVVESKTSDLKRVVVIKLNEGEKAPSSALAKGDLYFLSEYYPPLHPPKNARHGRGPRDHRDRDGKRKGKRGRRDGKKGRGGPRVPREGDEGRSARPVRSNSSPNTLNVGSTEVKPQSAENSTSSTLATSTTSST